MIRNIVQSIGIINLLIGISGIAGAIERDAGIVRSVTLIILGAAFVLADKYFWLQHYDSSAREWRNDRQ